MAYIPDSNRYSNMKYNRKGEILTPDIYLCFSHRGNLA